MKGKEMNEYFEMCVAWELATSTQCEKLKQQNADDYHKICLDIQEAWELTEGDTDGYIKALTEVLGE